MTRPTATGLPITDLRPAPADIAGDAVNGLSASPRRLPSKYFYDAHGSQLFEQITRQPEYYPTRVELALLDAAMPQIADAVAPHAHVVEYGSGSGRKTRLLLEGLETPVAYTPIEISRTALRASVERLAEEFPQVEYSHKYDDASFAALAARAGLRVVEAWNDPRDWFGQRLLVPA